MIVGIMLLTACFMHCFASSRPYLIIPTVNTSKDKVKAQLDLLRMGLEQRVHQSTEETRGPPGLIDLEAPGDHNDGLSRKEAPWRPTGGGALARNEFI